MKNLVKVGVMIGLGASLMTCERDRTYMELSSRSGDKVRIEVSGHDDPGFSVEAICFNKRGKRLNKGIFIGTISRENLNLGLHLYQARGGDLVGLHRDAEPSIVLLAVDFESGQVLGALDSERYQAPEKWEEALQDLSEVAGQKLKYTDYPVFNWVE